MQELLRFAPELTFTLTLLFGGYIFYRRAGRKPLEPPTREQLSEGGIWPSVQLNEINTPENGNGYQPSDPVKNSGRKKEAISCPRSAKGRKETF